MEIPTIDCDKLGHDAYRSGTPCFQRIVSTFGEDVIHNVEGVDVINRRLLGAKVFGKPDELKKLTDIVWPEIKRLSLDKINHYASQGAQIIILDAAVLLEAGWEDICHDVWVTFVPRDEVSPNL